MPQIIRPTDSEARTLARNLLAQARHGVLAVTAPDTGTPYAARIAIGQSPEGQPLTLISELAHHTRALHADPTCALLVGEPGPKGDPLTHPRLTLLARAEFVARDSDLHAHLARHYLTTHPKSQLYIGFADFSFALFHPTGAHLNGGFGKAFRLTTADLTP